MAWRLIECLPSFMPRVTINGYTFIAEPPLGPFHKARYPPGTFKDVAIEEEYHDKQRQHHRIRPDKPSFARHAECRQQGGGRGDNHKGLPRTKSGAHDQVMDMLPVGRKGTHALAHTAIHDGDHVH